MAEQEFIVRMKVTSTGLELFDQAGNKIGDFERKVQQANQTAGSGFEKATTAASTFNSTIGQTTERLATMATGSSQLGGTVGRMAEELGAANLALGVMAGAVAAVGAAYVAAVVSTYRYGQELNDVARATGINANELSKFKGVADNAQLSIREFGTGIQQLERQMVEASNGTGRAARLLEVLGVSAHDPIDALKQLADAFQRLPEGGVKVQAALALLGDAKWVTVLERGSAGIEDLIEKNREYGEMSQQTADAIKKLTTDFSNFWTVLSAGVVGDTLIPWLDTVLVKVTNVLKALHEARSQPGFFEQTENLVAGLQGRPPPARFGNVEAGTTTTAGREFEARVAGALGRPAPTGGGGGGAGDAARAQRELDKRTMAELNAEEKERVALIENEVKARDQALDFAQQDLRIAKESGASMAEQIAIAQRLDGLEMARLESVKARAEIELAEIEQYGPVASAKAVELEGIIERTNRELARGPDYVRQLTAEFERSREVVLDLGQTLNDSLRRVIDGLLNSKSGFNIGEIIANTIKTAISSIAGGALESLFSGGELKLKGMDGLTQSLGDVGQSIGNWIDKIGQLFGGAGAPSSIAGPTQTGQPIPIPGSGVGAFGSFTNLFGAQNLGAGGVAPTTGQNIIGAVPIIGTIITAAFAVASGAVEGLKKSAELRFKRGATEGEIASAAFGSEPIGQLWGSVLGKEWGGRIHADLLSAGLFEILIAAGAFAPKSGGTIVKKELRDILGALGLPEQTVFEKGGRTGIRVESIESSPNALINTIFTAFGIPGTGNLTQTQPRLAGLIAAGQTPSLEALRTGAAFGLGQVLEPNARQGAAAANALVNNFEILGESAGEARRELLLIAQAAGVTLISGLQELSRNFTAGHLTMAALQQSAAGLVDLFSQDLPKAVADMIPEIVAQATTARGIDIAAVQAGVLGRTEAYQLRQQVADARLNAMTSSRQTAEIERRVSEIDQQLTGPLTTSQREQLLQQRAQYGFQLVQIADQRFAPGTAARRTAEEAGFALVEDTAKKLDALGATIEDATNTNTSATTDNTEAIKKLTEALTGPSGIGTALTTKGQLDIAVVGDADPAVISRHVRNEIRKILKSPQFASATKTLSVNR